MTNPGEDRKRVTAIHEAGHAVVAHLLGRALGSMSIVPTAEHGGVTILAASPYLGPRLDPDALLIDQPSEARRWLEANALIRLAGSEAADLAFPRSGFGPDLETAIFSEGSAPPVVLDFDAAQEIAFQLAGSEAAEYLSWLRALSRRLVRERMPIIERLATALLERDRLSGDEARRIIEEVPQ